MIHKSNTISSRLDRFFVSRLSVHCRFHENDYTSFGRPQNSSVLICSESIIKSYSSNAARRDYFFGSPASSRTTSPVKYWPEPLGLGPSRTTTASRERITIVYYPINPEAIKASSSTPFHAPPRLSQNNPPYPREGSAGAGVEINSTQPLGRMRLPCHTPSHRCSRPNRAQSRAEP